MSRLRVITESLGGSPLAVRGMAGALPWLERRPAGVDGWRARVQQVASDRRISETALADAVGGTLPPRLAQTLAAGGVVVTTGQQPGLFGGPGYTLAKALSALALADAVQEATGCLVAPVFWAATDDADFREATRVWVCDSDGARELCHAQTPTDGIPMAEVPIEGLEQAMAAFLAACGSAATSTVPALVRRAYRMGATVGGAYVELLRGVLEPLGIAVLDASSAGLREAATPHLHEALRASATIAAALDARDAELVAAGVTPQVASVAGRSLVFTRVDGRKERVVVGQSVAPDAPLSANVLLRPALERRLLPTIAYVAGPGEFAYFAQVTAVASALGWAAPLVVPRWSGTVLPVAMEETVARLGLGWRDLAIAFAAEGVVARAATPASVLAALTAMREAIRTSADGVRAALQGSGSAEAAGVVDGTTRALGWRVDRLERRVVASVKRREAETMRALARARGVLFPGGGRQERALAWTPALAVHGAALTDALLVAARAHAEALVRGTPLPPHA